MPPSRRGYGWHQQELKAYIPPEADPASVAISIHRYGPATSSTAWFDKFSLTYLPAERFVADPSAAERTEVRFTLADGQTITRTFRPDFADWFAVPCPSSTRR